MIDKKYENQITNFRHKRQESMLATQQLERIIRDAQGKIDEIKRGIEEARPRSENGTDQCPDCKYIGGVYQGRIPEQIAQHGGQDEYHCEICGHCYTK